MLIYIFKGCTDRGLICITGRKNYINIIISRLSSQQLDWRSESPERTKLVKTINMETNDLLDCWLMMTPFFSHCAVVSLFQCNLSHIFKSLDACSEIRWDILLTLQRLSQ